MKPLSLFMQAFGAYAEPAVIDFERLDDSALFLITGPTGSGKSTILDAICFALYGDTSGDERSGRQMRSDHCPPGTTAEVRFDFRLGGECYRVCRKIEPERTRKTESIVPRVSVSASLWKRTGIADRAAEGSLLTEGALKVTEMVETLLGFKSDQFRQVIMIPQGQFRKLLLATSTERETILENLFRTGIYSRIQEALKTRSGEYRQKLDRICYVRKSILESAGFTTAEELTRDLERIQEEGKTLREASRTLQQGEKCAREELTAARKTAGLFAEYEEAVREHETLLSRREEMERTAVTLSLAEKALSLEDAETALTQRIAEELSSRRSRDAARSAGLAAEQELQAAKARHQEAVKAAETIPASREQLMTLQSLREKLEKYRETAALLEKTRAASETEQKKSESLREEKAARVKLLETQRLRLSEAELKAAQAGSFRSAVESLKRRAEALQLLSSADSAARVLEKALKELQSREENAALDVEAAKKELTILQIRLLACQASVLARTLVPGTPCPVCGSSDHPHPAPAAEEMPDEKQLEARGKALRELEAARDRIRSERAEAERNLAVKKTERDLILQQFPGLEAEAPATVARELSEKEAGFEAALQAEAAAAALKSGIEALEIQVAGMQKACDQAERDTAAAAAAFHSAASLKAERESGIPPDYLGSDRLEADIRRLETGISGTEKLCESTRASVSDCERRAAAAGAEARALEKAAASAEKNRDQQEETFRARLLQAGFTDTAGYEAARRTRGETERLRKETEAYTASLTSRMERRLRAEAAVKGLTAPDLRTLERKVEESRSALDEIMRRSERNAAGAEAAAQRLAEIARIDGEHEALEKEFRIYESLNEAASGKIGMRIPFQRFVLGALLDDVLASATMRLRVMSRGRFGLQRQSRTDDLRKSAGLDLSVYDSYTGSERPAATLSGGESFLAALSLALGMADVVQSYAGGIRLDTMFIDEGFGSLDPEALDAAMQALLELQKAGRLIGIISHVPELKERIDTRLEITSGRNGSCVRLVLP